nr:MAG TPA: hypothetical protein [Caudoviricetes sp.]
MICIGYNRSSRYGLSMCRLLMPIVSPSVFSKFTF